MTNFFTIDKRFLAAVAAALALHGLAFHMLSGAVRVGGKQLALPLAASAPLRVSVLSPISSPLDPAPQGKPADASPALSASETRMDLRKQVFNRSERVATREPKNMPADARQASKADVGQKESKEVCIQADELPQGANGPVESFASTGRVICEQG